MDEDEAIRAGFELAGAPAVRDRLGGPNPYNERYRALAVVWLGEQEAAAAERQLNIMRSAKNAAWAAAIAAFAAVLVALVALTKGHT